MPKPLDFEPKVFKDIREMLDGRRLSKEIKVAMGQAAIDINLLFEKSVTDRYRIDFRKIRAISNAKSSVTTVSGNILKRDLVYKHQTTDLAKFFYGNITHWNLYLAVPKPKRTGPVHWVGIRKDRTKQSTGKVGRGGFLVRGKGGFRRLIERKTKSRAIDFASGNTHNLLAWSPAQMVESVWKTDPQLHVNIDKVLSATVDKINENFAKSKKK